MTTRIEQYFFQQDTQEEAPVIATLRPGEIHELFTYDEEGRVVKKHRVRDTQTGIHINTFIKDQPRPEIIKTKDKTVLPGHIGEDAYIIIWIKPTIDSSKISA